MTAHEIPLYGHKKLAGSTVLLLYVPIKVAAGKHFLCGSGEEFDNIGDIKSLVPESCYYEADLSDHAYT